MRLSQSGVLGISFNYENVERRIEEGWGGDGRDISSTLTDHQHHPITIFMTGTFSLNPPPIQPSKARPGLLLCRPAD